MDPEKEILKFMYNNVYDELNRARDWPFRFFGIGAAFITLIVTAIYSIIPSNVHIDKVCEINCNKSSYNSTIYSLNICIAIITISTGIIIWRQHTWYLKYRDIQKKIQYKLKINELANNHNDHTIDIFPKTWTDITDNSNSWKNHIGVIYYLLFLAVILISSIIIMSNLTHECSR